MDMLDVELLCHLHECRPFVQIAGDCGFTVQAVSKRIRRIEAELGVTLLDRTTRGNTPTPYFDAIFPSMVRIQDEWQSVCETARECNSKPTVDCYSNVM